MKSNSVPMRRCAGCMVSKDKSMLIRIAGYNGNVSVDLEAKAPGRGVYVCRDMACIEKAMKKKALARSLKTEISAERGNEITEELRALCEIKF